MPLNLTSNDRQKPRGVGEKLLQSSTMEVSFPSLQFNTTTGTGNLRQEKTIHWSLSFAILLIAKSLNLSSTHCMYQFFRSLSMIAYIIEIQNPKLANI